MCRHFRQRDWSVPAKLFKAMSDILTLIRSDNVAKSDNIDIYIEYRYNCNDNSICGYS